MKDKLKIERSAAWRAVRIQAALPTSQQLSTAGVGGAQTTGANLLVKIEALKRILDPSLL